MLCWLQQRRRNSGDHGNYRQKGCKSFHKLSLVLVLTLLVTCRYVTEEDLEVFKHRVERDGAVPGAGPWEAMMTKDFGDLTYEAWRRTLPVRTAFTFSSSRALQRSVWVSLWPSLWLVWLVTLPDDVCLLPLCLCT